MNSNDDVISSLLQHLKLFQPATAGCCFARNCLRNIFPFYPACRYLVVPEQRLPDGFWYCSFPTGLLWTVNICSTLFILSMTFDRFYSIIRPHKAASFNTVKRAKITIAFIIVFSCLFNVPHLFITVQVGMNCVPYGFSPYSTLGQVYYWLSMSANFFIPFVLLLVMNSVIIHKLRKRAHKSITRLGKGQSQGHNHQQGQLS